MELFQKAMSRLGIIKNNYGSQKRGPEYGFTNGIWFSRNHLAYSTSETFI